MLSKWWQKWHGKKYTRHITAVYLSELGDSKAHFIFTWLFKYLVNTQKAKKPPFCFVSTTEITNFLFLYVHVYAVTYKQILRLVLSNQN